MERMMKFIKALVLAVILVVALSTCMNPFDFVAAVTDEVMVAKDMYLEVTEVTPVKNTAAFNPETPILIEFDRAIDLASVTSSSVVISPAENWPEPTFDTGTNTLMIKPYSLEGGAPYTITINSGVKGIDGSVVRTPYIWNFSTDNLPTGGLVIKDRLTLSATYSTIYTNERYVDLAIEANGVVNQMRYSQTSFLKANDTLIWETVDDLKEDYELELGSDGERTVYIQFRKYSISPAIDLRTEVKSDTIILDTAAPVVTLNNPPTYFNGEPGGWTSDISITEAGSGVASHAWSRYSGTDVNFSTTNQLNTTVTCSIEGSTRIRLAVKDTAENTGFYTSPAIPIDLTDPTAPSVTGTASPGTILPSYSWTPGGGGNGTYRRNLDGGAWTEPATTPYSSASMTFGLHTFYVQERDDAGNWSSSGSYQYFYYPTYLRPEQASTGVSRQPLFVFGEGEVPKYTTCQIYGGTDSRKLELWTPEAVPLVKTWSITWATIAAQRVAPELLPGLTKFYWTFVLLIREEKLYTSPIYSFTTAKY
ncbi:MAG: hypothetical protein A2177_15875 [Spirochaetes bacterium RBG_13_68_11]|nr:MAG: hypothetical protein A2177_15875 [Spirochaetes bacterium RBG_13_68_11]